MGEEWRMVARDDSDHTAEEHTTPDASPSGVVEGCMAPIDEPAGHRQSPPAHPGGGAPEWRPVQGARAPSLGAVVVVDDDDAIRESLGLMLADEGYAVTMAQDGVEALEALRAADRPMVVLLDIMMPRLGGEGVLREVQRDARLASRHAFIVVTANPHTLTSGLREQLGALGIPILPKPVDIDDLLAAVAQARRRLPPRRRAPRA